LNHTASLLAKQYEVLAHEKLGYTEIRIPKKKFQYFFKAGEKEEPLNEHIKGDVYIGINPRKSKSGLASDVSFVTCLVFDFDPIRPKDTPSTDEQHADALAVANRLHTDSPGSILVDSGSGAHVYIPVVPIEVKDWQDMTACLAGYAKTVKEKYQTANIRVDSIFDLSRIIRLWGSHNEKSNRPCRVVSGLDNYRRSVFNPGLYRPATVVSEVSSGSSDFLVRFDKLKKVTPKIQEIMNGTAKYASRNEADLVLTDFLIKSKFADSEIVAIRRMSPLSKDDRTDEWHMEDVKRLRNKLVQDSGVKRIDSNYFSGLDTRKPGILTGFNKLDSMLAGLKSGRLYVIAARPNEGKTTLLTQIANGLAKQGVKVLFFPTESGASAIYDKVLSADLGINLRKFQFGNFTTAEKQSINAVTGTLNKLPLYVCEDFGLTPDTVESKIKQLCPDVVIVDYLQGMTFPEGGTPLELGKAVIKFKGLCQDLQIPFILASQLNRAADGNPLSLSHLNGTAKLEQQGDEVLMLHTLDTLVYPRPINLYIKKSKFGKTGMVKMDFLSSICTFKEQANQEDKE
jgi:KaiC/GvpD/RAD55 family RecA-like ATPase